MYKTLQVPLLPKGGNRKASWGNVNFLNHQAQPESLFFSNVASKEGWWKLEDVCGLSCP
jgi:hypothetical protein